jgi:hypothetical protein
MKAVEKYIQKSWLDKNGASGDWIGGLLVKTDGKIEFCCRYQENNYIHENMDLGDFFHRVLRNKKGKDLNTIFGFELDESFFQRIGTVESFLSTYDLVYDFNPDIFKEKFAVMEELLQKVTISRPVFYEGLTSILVTSNDLVALAAYEIIKLCEMRVKFIECPCGLWYARKPKQNKDPKKYHCPSCPHPSKRKDIWSDYKRFHSILEKEIADPKKRKKLLKIKANSNLSVKEIADKLKMSQKEVRWLQEDIKPILKIYEAKELQRLLG